MSFHSGFHSLLKHNFKSDSRVHTEIPKRDRQENPRIAQIKGLMGNLGIAVDNMKELYSDHGGSFKGLWNKLVGSDAFTLGIQEVVAYGAGTLAEGMSGGSVAALTGLATEAAQLYGKYTGKEYIHSFKPGDWVGIDNGTVQIKKKIRKALEWGLGSIFEDFPDDEDIEVETEHLTSFGFVVGEGSGLGKVTVFNFETGEKQEKLKYQVVALPKEKQDLLDANINMRTIKEIIINDKPVQPKKMRCE